MNRYTPFVHNVEKLGFRMAENPEGEWIKFEDYEKEVARLEARVKELIAKVNCLNAENPE